MTKLVKTFCISLLLLSLSACKNNTETKATDSPIATKVDTAAFFALFKDLRFDSLHINTIDDSINKPNSFIAGVSIDTMYGPMFTDSLRSDGIHIGSFAVGRFDLGDGQEALIIRHRGEFTTSHISLFIYDQRKHAIRDEYFGLADEQGDAGESFVYSSVLRRSGSKLLVEHTDEYRSPVEADTTFSTFTQAKIKSTFYIEHGSASESKEISRMEDTIRTN